MLNSRMKPSRRQVLGTLGAAGAASLFDPAQQPCTGADPGTLLGTLPLFRSGGQEQPFASSGSFGVARGPSIV